MPQTPAPGDAWTRQLIALVVVGVSLLCVAAISGPAIGFANDKAATSRLVLTSVLPVLGTWVGTVLASYFARENFEAAISSLARRGGGAPFRESSARTRAREESWRPRALRPLSGAVLRKSEGASEGSSQTSAPPAEWERVDRAPAEAWGWA